MSLTAEEPLRAFPGAEGFGAYAKGGRGGAVYCVTTLEDYHPGAAAQEEIRRIEGGALIVPAQDAIAPERPIPGSLRAAIDAEGPRTIVFRVSGTIALKAPLAIENPFLTLAGETAPGDGICLKNYGLNILYTHDVIVRHLRVRPGDLSRTTPDAITVHASQDVIVDHCSTSWAVDENLSLTGEGADNISIQWCLISESLHDSWHPKGPHGMGSLIRADGRISYHHNLYAMNNARSPRPGTYGNPRGIRFDFRNNLIFNWGQGAGYSAADPVTMNYIGNYIKPGPAVRHSRLRAFSIGGDTTYIYAAGNLLVDGETRIEDDWAMMYNVRKNTKRLEPFPVTAIKTESAEEAYAAILKQVGATQPKRDAVDTRVIAHVENNTGAIIHSQESVGGWPRLNTEDVPKDSDNDGMPDTWEEQHGLDPVHPADQAETQHDGGYTHLENYLHSLAARSGR